MKMREALATRDGRLALQEVLPANSTLLSQSVSKLAESAMGTFATMRSATQPLSREQLEQLLRAELSAMPPHPEQRESIEASLKRVAMGAPIVLVPHQPIALAYTALWGQFVLADRIKRHLGSPKAVSIYLVCDMDDATDPRIRCSHYPSALARDGSISLSFDYGRHRMRNVPQLMTPPVSFATIDRWLTAIDTIIRRESASHLGRGSQLIRRLGGLSESLKSLAASTESAAEFNATLLTRFVGTLVEPPLALRMSTIYAAAADDLADYIRAWPVIAHAAGKASALLEGLGISIGSPELRKPTYPTWQVCQRCNRKVPSRLDEVYSEHSLSPEHVCEGAALSWQTRWERASGPIPRVIIEDLFLFGALAPILTLTYIGSAEHVVIAQFTSEEIFGVAAPAYTSQPCQPYYGADPRIDAYQTSRARSARARIESCRESIIYAMVHKVDSEGLFWPDLDLDV